MMFSRGSKGSIGKTKIKVREYPQDGNSFRSLFARLRYYHLTKASVEFFLTKNTIFGQNVRIRQYTYSFHRNFD